MGLNLSNRQIAKEVGLCESDVQRMTAVLRAGVIERKPTPKLSGEVEFDEVHVNTMEGFWSLLRSWLRPHRGISQENPPNYLGFFEYIHNIRKRGKAVLSSLLSLLLQPYSPSP